MELEYALVLQVLLHFCSFQWTDAVRSKSLKGPTNCYDCVFQQTKCIKQCIATYDCTKNIVKEGFCPYGGAVIIRNCPKISTLSSCETDNDCSGSKKCCNNGCRKLCSTPLPFPPPTVSKTSFTPRKTSSRRSRYYSHRVWNPRRKPKPRPVPFRIPKTVAVTTTTTTTTTTTEKPSKAYQSNENDYETEVNNGKSEIESEAGSGEKEK